MAENNKKMEYVISACLIGVPCRWNQKRKINKKALNIFLQGKALALCPEIMAGLSTPRPACEIQRGDGGQVLKGQAKVVDKKGRDCSQCFIDGAYNALKVVQKYGIKKAILKSGSPSCGAVYIYKGDFSGRKKRGKGVFAALLKKEGVKVNVYDDGLINSRSLEDSVREFKPDLIGITSFSYCYDYALDCINKIKSNFNIPVVLGGPHVSMVKKDVFKNSHIDFAIKKEGEYSLLELLRSLKENKKDLACIRNLIWKNEDRVVENEDMPFLYQIALFRF